MGNRKPSSGVHGCDDAWTSARRPAGWCDCDCLAPGWLWRRRKGGRGAGDRRPRVLDVIVDTCNADLDTTVTETDNEVVIGLDNNDRALFDTGDDDCQDLVTIELEQPLGDRSVVLDDGAPVRLLPFPPPTAVFDETATGPISYCGLDDPSSLGPDREWSDAEIHRHNENTDLASLTSQAYRSDPDWSGLSGRYDDNGDFVFIFHCTDVDPQRAIDIGVAMGEVPFEVAPAMYTDDELEQPSSASKISSKPPGTDRSRVSAAARTLTCRGASSCT